MLRSGRWGDGEIASFGRTVLTLAAIAIVLGALHLASEFVTPVLLALVLALIFWPVYVWLRGRGLEPWLALLALLVGLVVAFALLVVLVSYSMSSMATRLTVYSEHLSANMQQLDALLASHGLADVDLVDLLSPQTLASLFAWLAGTLASALRQGFIILLLLLFFVAEGPFIMARLRASLREDDPNIARLSVYGRDVSQYFILRAAVNAVTGAGVALVLWLLGVDFPLLWGVLTFFLSFIPYIGMFVASVPSVLLAYAEYDLGRALVVVVALTVVNATAENLVQPALMHKGLHLSPTFVILSVFFWSSLLSGGGSFLAVPLSLAVLMLLANFPAAQWFVSAATTSVNDDPSPRDASAAVASHG
jgi:predicted PurR-regulated permease PerM